MKSAYSIDLFTANLKHTKLNNILFRRQTWLINREVHRMMNTTFRVGQSLARGGREEQGTSVSVILKAGGVISVQ